MTTSEVLQNEAPMSAFHNRYLLHQQLGAGGMGVVYRATDRLHSRTVALKQLTFALPASNPQTDPNTHEARVALAWEFRALATLHHPNIINVNEYGFDDNRQPYITMDLLENARTLTQAGNDQSLTTQVQLLVEMLQGLKYIHRRGIIHRDLKPANVLVEAAAGKVKILDFGLSIDQGIRTPDAMQEGLAGTIAYIAPELFSGFSASPASDLYAVGVMAYEIFTGQYPYQYTPRIPARLITVILTRQPDYSPLPPELAEVVSRLMHKQPEERYQDAAEVIADLCRAVDLSIPQEPFEIRESFIQASAFVGRDAQLAQLLQALQQITRPATADASEQDSPTQKGSLWLIGGESGVGKSRLIDELRINAAIEGALVLRGQGVDGGGRPQELWREPLRALALIVEMTDLEASILAEIVPDISELLNRPLAAPPRLDERSTQRRLVNTIVSVFQRLKQPALVMLEDLQWVEESLNVLTALVNVVDRLPLLIVGSYRSDERPDLPEKFPSARIISLNRLSEDEIKQLTGMMLGDAGRSPEVIDLIQRETEGNAFFIVEVVRALAEDAGSLSNIGSRTLPSSIVAGGIRNIVQRRLQSVPPQAYDLLKRAAVAGRDIQVKVLEQFHSDDLTPWLQLCANAAVLEFADGRWRFAHDKLRESLLATLSDDEKRTLNREIATAFEAVYSQDELHQSFALLMAEAWYQAQEWAKAAAYGYIAALQLHDVGNLRDALRLSERAIETTAPGESDSEIALYLMLVKLAGLTASNLGEYTLSETYQLKMLELARQKQQLLYVQKALNDLANLKMMTGDYALSHDYANQSLQIAESRADDEGRANALLTIGLAMGSQGQFALSLEYFERSLLISREVNNLRLISTNLNSLGVSSHYMGNFRAAREYYEEALNVARQLGDINRVGLLLGNMGSALNHLNEFELAKEYQLEALRIRQQVGDRRGIVNSYNSLGWDMIRNNNVGEALEFQQKALAEAKTLGDRRQLGLCYRDLGWVEILVGLIDEGRSKTEIALKIFEETDDRANPMKCAISFSVIALIQQNYTDAVTRLTSALEYCVTEKLDAHAFDLRFALGFALPALDRRDEILPHLRAMIEVAQTEGIAAQWLSVMATVANWLVTGGQTLRAAELWAIINAHPRKDAEFEYLWLPMLRTALDAALPFEALAEAFERGRAGDYSATVEEITQEFAAP